MANGPTEAERQELIDIANYIRVRVGSRNWFLVVAATDAHGGTNSASNAGVESQVRMLRALLESFSSEVYTKETLKL